MTKVPNENYIVWTLNALIVTFKYIFRFPTVDSIGTSFVFHGIAGILFFYLVLNLFSAISVVKSLQEYYPIPSAGLKQH